MQSEAIKEAIADYYLNDRSTWSVINGGLSEQPGEVSTVELYDVLKGIDPQKLEEIKSINGKNLGYGYVQSIAGDANNNPIYETFDSNINPGEFSQANSVNVKVNASTFQDPQTGEVSIKAGSYKIDPTTGVKSTVATVADRISLGVMGVNIGCKLGKFIDETLYNSDPDFWDKHFPEINPETWDSLATSQGGKNFVRSLFGLDSSGNMVAYIDEQLLAYTYQLYRDLGLLNDQPSVTPESEIPIGEYTPQYIHAPADQLASTAFGLPLYPNSFSTDALLVVDWDGQTGLIVRQDGRNWDMKETVNVSDELVTGVYQTTGLTIDNHMILLYRPGGDYNPAPPGTISYEGQTNAALRNLTNGIVSTQTGGLKVITGELIPKSVKAIPNATQYPPDNITGTNPQQVNQQLKTNYPDLYRDSIKENVVQPDGSIQEITYVPIPWVTTDPNPDVSLTPDNPKTITSPVTNPNVNPQDQANPNIADDALPQIVENPNTNPNTPTTDTGTGVTPVITPVTGSASSLWRVYNPSQSQIDAFGAWLWSSDFVDQIKKLFVDPMQAIIGVHKVFVNPDTSGSGNIKCGYLDSGISAPIVSNQYKTINCGTVSLTEYYGNVYDYEPFTSVKCFLPFIGIVPLDISFIMRSKINIKYKVDVITGACLAEIKVSRDGCNNVIYTYSGSAIVTYPLSSGSYAGVISSVIQSALGIAMQSPTTVVSGILSAHADTSVNGSFSGCAGAMGCKIPYLIISRPQVRFADDSNKFIGLGANYTTTIESCTGFFKVKDVHLHIEGAYDSEINEINSILHSGVLMEGDYSAYYYEPQISDIEGITITENGRYEASGEIRGYSPINVNVSPVLITTTVTSNGVYNAIDYNADGFSVFTVNVPTSTSITGFELYGATFRGTTQTFKGRINNNYIVCCFHDNMPSTYTLNGVTKNFTAIANGSGSGKIKASTLSVTGNTDTGLNAILLDGSELVSRHDDNGSYMSVVGAWVGYPYGGSIYENAVSDSLTNSITMSSAHTKLLIFIAGSKAGLQNVTTVSINGITYNITNMGTAYDSVYSVYAAIEIDNNTDDVITVTYPVSCHNYMSIIGFD